MTAPARTFLPAKESNQHRLAGSHCSAPKQKANRTSSQDSWEMVQTSLGEVDPALSPDFPITWALIANVVWRSV